MRIIVTGAGGFIGSHLCEQLLQHAEYEVIGIDDFIRTETSHIQKRNLQALLKHARFIFIEENLLHIDWKKILYNVDIIFHLAAVPGVRTSWGNDFSDYITNNISVTQRLLEACRNSVLKKFIYASTSSVYGEKVGKVAEDAPAAPLSPYGVSKLTGEHLCQVYHHTDGLPVVILRYFTVYGPRQRLDMAFHQFIKAMIEEQPIPVYGDGKQTRDFTYIGDCVKATAAVIAAQHVIGETINIGGVERASILDVVKMLEEMMGKKANIDYLGDPRGEPKHTWADISKAEKLLHYTPKINLKRGLEKEFEDLLVLYKG